jgi:drug/metabolite transporter (DMT)-like permease
MRRMMAILAGFVGTLIILRPGFQTIEAGSLAQLIAAFCFAGSFVCQAYDTEREPG